MVAYNLLFLLLIFLLASCAEDLKEGQKDQPTISKSQPELPQPVQYDYISGVHEFDILSSEQLHKKVYLLGEIHKIQGRCPTNLKKSITVADFIYSLPSFSMKFIDIFLEAIPDLDAKTAAKAFGNDIAHVIGHTRGPDRISYLGEVEDRLKDCFDPSHICPYKNMRVHWTDLRSYAEQKIFEGLKPHYSLGVIPYGWDVGKNIQYFTSATSIFDFIKENFLTQGKIKKQWETLPKDYFDILLTLIKSELETEEKERIDYIKNLIVVNSDGSSWISSINLDQASVQVLSVISYVTDAYSIGRFLKTFNEMPDSPFPAGADNAVFYFGAAHTRFVKKFLLKIGFKEQQKFTKLYEKDNTVFDICLYVKGLYRPFF